MYLVSLSESADTATGLREAVPMNDAALDELISVCPELTVDGDRSPSRTLLAERIGRYWLTDEPVLYIGLAGQPLRTRVRQYYTTPLGAAKPHKGGWWLKTLSVLDRLYVHWGATSNFKDAEEEMMRTFAASISPASSAEWPAGEPVMPFANLRDGDWRRRSHGIGGATSGTARASRSHAPRSTTTAPQPRVPRQSPYSPAAERKPPQMDAAAHHRTPDHPSQNVTAKDIEAGQVRIPRAAKDVLPQERTDIQVVLRGRELGICRWDPRYGPPERSGVIRVGRSAAQALLRPGEVLAVSVDGSGMVGLD
ncbi:MAG: hypothetical protein U0T02_12530 [Solirubrobacteraceae bacterium]